jgi:hypothetical protein
LGAGTPCAQGKAAVEKMDAIPKQSCGKRLGNATACLKKC